MDSFFFSKEFFSRVEIRLLIRELTYNVIIIDCISTLLAYWFINSRLTRLILFLLRFDR